MLNNLRFPSFSFLVLLLGCSGENSGSTGSPNAGGAAGSHSSSASGSGGQASAPAMGGSATGGTAANSGVFASGAGGMSSSAAGSASSTSSAGMGNAGSGFAGSGGSHVASGGAGGSSAGASSSAGATGRGPAPTFTKIYETIITPSCGGTQCHLKRPTPFGYDFSSKSAASASWRADVFPNDAENSPMFQVLNLAVMPKDKPPLSVDQLFMVYDWINAGALDN